MGRYGLIVDLDVGSYLNHLGEPIQIYSQFPRGNSGVESIEEVGNRR